MNATALDRRILDPGLRVTVADLVAVFIDHYSPEGALATCRGCGHRLTTSVPLCPSMALTVPLLRRRRREDPGAVPEWVRKALHDIKLPPAPRQRPAPVIENVELFDAAPYVRAKPSRRTPKPTA